MKWNDFARKSGFLFLAINIGSVMQFVFQAVMGRMLTDPQFGLMNALFCLMNLAGTVACAIQMDLARHSALAAQAGAPGEGLRAARRVFLRVLPWGILLAIGTFLARDWLAGFFNAVEPLDVLAVGMAGTGMAITLLAFIANGYFAGMQWFALLGVLGLIQPVLRILGGGGLVRGGMGTSGAVIATFGVSLLPLGYLVWRMFRDRPSASARPAMETENIFWLALVSIGINTVLTNTDLVLVKHYFPGADADAFASAGVFGRAMVFFLGPLGMVLLPLSTVQVAKDAQDPNRVLWECLKLCLALGVVAAALGGLLAAPALWILKGRTLEPEVAQLLRLYLWAMLPTALVTVIMNHVLAINSWRIASRAALLTALYPVAIVLWHPSLGGVLLLNFLAGAVILAFLLWRLREPHSQPSVVPRQWNSVSVIMPAYNEARSIREAILRTHRELKRLSDRLQIVAVDDGSTDGTGDILDRLAGEMKDVTVVRLSPNRGKGEAIRQGFYKATGELVFFLDSDMDLPPEQMNVLLDTLKAEGADVVIGCKLHPLSRIEYPFHRRVISRVYFAITRLLFRLPIHDTQTGLKVFRREVLDQCMPRLLIGAKAFAYDLELLVLAHYYGFRIAEAPVVVEYHPKYGWISPFVILRTGIDTLAIFYRLYVLKYYDKILSGRIPTP